MDGIVSLTVFALVLAAALMIRARASSPAQNALARLARASSVAGVDAAIRRSPRWRPRNDSALWGAFSLFDNPATRWLEQMMLQAALYSPVTNVLALMAALLVGGASCILLFGGGFLIAGAGGVALLLVPICYIKFLQQRRLRAFSEQLPDVLDLLKSSLEAGHSLHRGLQVLGDEFPDPVRGEMRIILEQTRLGMSLPRAFEDMLARVPEDGLNFLVVAVKIQSEVGSSLAEVIGRLSETIRARHRIRLQIKALTAQPRMSGMILALLPFIVLGFFMFIQPDYTMMLFRDPIGIKISKIAVALDLTAFVVIRRVLKTDY